MRILIIICTFIWVGFVLGISFLEAPLKFQAPNITTELGLGIGKIVYSALNKVEILLAILISAGILFGKFSFKKHFLFPTVFGIIIVQTLWLLPILDERASMIISGQEVPDTYHHLYYVILEIIKVPLLLIAGISFIKKSKI